MTEIVFLSSHDYETPATTNYGDCILINTGSELIIYDCGSEEHADSAISYMDQHGYKSAKLILSHNDNDHFKGIPKLLEQNRVSSIHTLLLLKYKEELLKRIGDGRKTARSIAEQILDTYDNIATLSGASLEDIYKGSSFLCPEVKIVGPDLDYMLDSVAKLLNTCESDNIDDETIINATSIQVAVSIGNYSLLLTGDASFTAIEDKVRRYDAIQLPHHGKPQQAENIFTKKSDQLSSIYIVSDNTGNTNGGSDNLDTRGHRAYNTKGGQVVINASSFFTWKYHTGTCLGV